MAELIWHSPGSNRFETGVDRGVLFVGNRPGVAWNGLIKITNGSSGGSVQEYFIDGLKYHQEISGENATLSIEAYTYPEEFEECDGTSIEETGLSFEQQRRKPFNLAYRTKIGNEAEGLDLGYKLHFVYGALAAPTSEDYSTIVENPDAMTFNWTVTTKPVIIPGRRPTSKLSIDSTKASRSVFSEVEAILYGGRYTNPRMPTPKELIDIFDKYRLTVNENYDTGLSTLSNMVNKTGESDVTGSLDEGIFEKSENGRLTAHPTLPGLYILE